MSQLLEKLKQSEAKNNDQPTATRLQRAVSAIHPVRQGKLSMSRLWPLLIGLVPAAMIISYKYTQQNSHEQPLTAGSLGVVSTNEQQLLQAPTKTVMPEALATDDVIFLEYPTLITEPLPIGDSLYTAEPAYQAFEFTNTEPDASQHDEPKVVPAVQPSPKPVTPKVVDNKDPYQLDNLDLSGFSPELAAQLKSAIIATGEPASTQIDSPVQQETKKIQPTLESHVIPIGLLPRMIQDKLPKMDFEQHIYSSKPANRWVKVNGKELHEGDDIAPGVTLARIEARDVILRFDGYEISMPALSEW